MNYFIDFLNGPFYKTIIFPFISVTVPLLYKSLSSTATANDNANYLDSVKNRAEILKRELQDLKNKLNVFRGDLDNDSTRQTNLDEFNRIIKNLINPKLAALDIGKLRDLQYHHSDINPSNSLGELRTKVESLITKINQLDRRLTMRTSDFGLILYGDRFPFNEFATGFDIAIGSIILLFTESINNCNGQLKVDKVIVFFTGTIASFFICGIGAYFIRTIGWIMNTKRMSRRGLIISYICGFLTMTISFICMNIYK